MRRIILAFFALLLATGAFAQTGTNKTAAQLNTEIGTTGCTQPTCLWPDNTLGLITPFDLRQVGLDVVASSAILQSANLFLAQQIVDLGSGTSEPAAGSGAAWSAYGADGFSARFEATAFNNAVSGAAAIFDGRTSLGTRGSPLAVTSGTMLASFEGKGYDTSVWTGTGAALHIYAEGTFSGTSHAGEICEATTASGATATTDWWCIHNDGGVTLGSPTGGDKGANTLNLPAGAIYDNNVAPTGTGAYAHATSPTFVTPTLGAASGTSFNGLTVTSTTGTLTIANGQTLTDTSAIFSGVLLRANSSGGFQAYTAQNCTNQAVTALSTSGNVTCTTLTGSYLASNTVAFSNVAQLAAVSLLGNPTGSLANVAGITLGSTLNFSGTTLNVTTASASQLGAAKCDNSTITCASGVFTAVGAASTSVGASGTITGITGTITTGYLLYNNAGYIGNESIATALGTRATNPTTQQFLSGTNVTYTTPAGVLWIKVTIVGGGGAGGPGNGTGGSNGNPSCLNTSSPACTSPVYEASGGNSPGTGAGGNGGQVSGSGTCNVLSVPGGSGTGGNSNTATVNTAVGGHGGDSSLGGAGGGAQDGNNVGLPGATNSGGGGGGGGTATASTPSGAGGGGGATCVAIINSPAANYYVTVGGTVASGTPGTGGSAGGLGSAGQVVFEEHYGS